MKEHPREEEQVVTPASSNPKAINVNFIIFISGSLVIALLLVVLSMVIYQKSGAAQLDLSRPSYEAVRSQAQQSDKVKDFGATGELNEAALKEFNDLYQKTAEDVDSHVNSFSSEAIDNKALSIEIE